MKLLKFYVKHFPINSLLEIYFDKDWLHRICMHAIRQSITQFQNKHGNMKVQMWKGKVAQRRLKSISINYRFIVITVQCSANSKGPVVLQAVIHKTWQFKGWSACSSIGYVLNSWPVNSHMQGPQVLYFTGSQNVLNKFWKWYGISQFTCKHTPILKIRPRVLQFSRNPHALNIMCRWSLIQNFTQII